MMLRFAMLSLLLLLLLTSFSYSATQSPNIGPIDQEKFTLIFNIDQGFGNGIVVHNDQVALTRIIAALDDLKARYNVCVIVNPMVANKIRLDAVLDTLAARKMPFLFDIYTSDGNTLGCCGEQNLPYDPEHGITMSLAELAKYRKRYGKWLVGLRFMEVMAHDFTIRAVKTTNPEWALPCWKIAKDRFFQPKFAEAIIKFAHDNDMFVEFSDWHWYEFAGWDAEQKNIEDEIIRIFRKYPETVTVTYANNEPNEESVPKLGYWQKSFERVRKESGVKHGLNIQSWLRKDESKCSAEDVIQWTRSALESGSKLIQFEPAWFFFKLPFGTFGVQSYTHDPKWNERGRPTDKFEKLEEFLISRKTD